MPFPLSMSFSEGSAALKGNWTPNLGGPTQLQIFFIKEHRKIVWNSRHYHHTPKKAWIYGIEGNREGGRGNKLVTHLSIRLRSLLQFLFLHDGGKECQEKSQVNSVHI